MNIQNNYNYNVNMQGKGNTTPSGIRRFLNKAEQKVLDIFKEKTLNETESSAKKLNDADSTLSRPDVGRIIMGATAITTQPFIDYYNHRVDDETRTVARNRTIAKIVAGTSVGAVVRWSCFNLIKSLTNTNGSNKLSKLLLPKNPQKLNRLLGEKLQWLGKYRNLISNATALFVMCFTNFLLDAPLTTYFTNKLNAKSEKIKNVKEEMYA